MLPVDGRGPLIAIRLAPRINIHVDKLQNGVRRKIGQLSLGILRVETHIGLVELNGRNGQVPLVMGYQIADREKAFGLVFCGTLVRARPGVQIAEADLAVVLGVPVKYLI